MLVSRGSDTDKVSSMTTIPTPMSPYDIVGPEEVSEPKEKSPTNKTKENHQRTQTSDPTKGDPTAKKHDTGKRYVAGLPSSFRSSRVPYARAS